MTLSALAGLSVLLGSALGEPSRTPAHTFGSAPSWRLFPCVSALRTLAGGPTSAAAMNPQLFLDVPCFHSVCLHGWFSVAFRRLREPARSDRSCTNPPNQPQRLTMLCSAYEG